MSVLDKASAYIGAMTDRFDAWVNTLTGLGTSRDKRTYTELGLCPPLGYDQLGALYEASKICQRIVAQPVKKQLAKGWEYKGDLKEDQKKELADLKVRLGVVDAVLKAKIWGRLYGGAAILLVTAGGGNPEQPLTVGSVRELVALKVYVRQDIIPEYQADERYQNAFRAEYYTIGNLRVHRSRLILFGGLDIEDSRRGAYAGWDASVLQPVWQVVRDSEVAYQSIGGMLEDASVGIFKIKNLMHNLANNDEDKVAKRLTLIDMSKSITRSIALDAEHEDFDYVQRTWAGLAEILAAIALRVASVAEMPVSVLFGREPAGLNATGESEMRLWYDELETDRGLYTVPKLQLLERLCLLSVGAQDDSPELCFPALWSPTDKEQAETDKIRADTDAVYVQNEILPPEVIALSRFLKEGGFAGLTIPDKYQKILDKVAAIKLKEYLDDAKDPKDPPPTSIPPGAPASGNPTPARPGSDAANVQQAAAGDPSGNAKGSGSTDPASPEPDSEDEPED